MPSESESSINFFSEAIDFEVDQPDEIRKWLLYVVDYHEFKLESLNYIFCSDTYLLPINQQYLHHDSYTDIITFDYTREKVIQGEIFISIDRVRENANQHSVSFIDELHRVMIHGVLHLMGFKDKTANQQVEMRSAEDFCLNLRTF